MATRRFLHGTPAVLLVLVAIGCTVDRTVAISTALSRLDGGSDSGFDAGLDEATIERQWGMYAATLPIPPCDQSGALVVDTLDDVLEGGPGLSARADAGTTLSLREAMFIAQNTTGPKTIAFAPAVFPPGAAATIHVTDGVTPFPSGQLEDTCVDARGRGVIVEFDFNGPCEDTCSWLFSRGSLLTGMVIKGNIGKIGVANARIAGNRLMVRYQALQLVNGAIVGPSNVFGHGSYALRLDFYGGSPPYAIVAVDGNFFGIEPTTHADLDLTVGVSSFAQMNITNNVGNAAMQVSGSPGGAVSANQLLRIGGGSPQVTVQGDGWVLSQNLFEGGVFNIPVAGGNSFSQNTIASGFTSAGPTANIADAGVGSVAGDCPALGTVEVYGRSDAVWRPVGTVACDSNPTWSLASTDLAAGSQAATLFTTRTPRNTGPFSPPVSIPGSR